MRNIKQNNLIKNLSRKAIAGLVFGIIATTGIAMAGNLNPTSAPGDTMKTLDDIYSAMAIDTTATTSYGIDSPGTPTSTMYTLQEIYDVAVKFPLPDTGQDKCYNATAESACPVSGFPGQDAESTSTNSFTCDRSSTDNGDNTITDNCTGLMWKKCTEGRNNDSTCSGAVVTYTWANALLQCDNLNFPTDVYTDWRLPNIKELVSIIDYATSSPSINRTFFPGTLLFYYWSSTTYFDDSSDAWSAQFTDSSIYFNPKTNDNAVRCVRGG